MRDNELELIDGKIFLFCLGFTISLVGFLIFIGDVRNALFTCLAVIWMNLYWFETRRLINLYKNKVTVEFNLAQKNMTKKEIVELKKQLDDLFKEVIRANQPKV